jgi:catechol 2,3-dioxygenase-like lactoylglutathione lyase family enzyme
MKARALAVLLLPIALIGPQTSDRVTVPAIVGLDHIPIAVRDLENAASQYRQLGFALKPGRPHENGIQNQHAKFPDGTELELITAPKAVDPLTTIYRRHLASGDGPAFLAFFAPETARVAERLDAMHQPYAREGASIDLPAEGSTGYIFFSGRNHSPTDRPEHFAHANGAQSLIGVWLAASDLSSERRLLEGLGGTFVEQERRVPTPLRATVAHFPEGEVVFLPPSHQLVTGRRIVGATLRVQSAATVRRFLTTHALRPADVVAGDNGSSVFLPPAATHGIWLEFRESR